MKGKPLEKRKNIQVLPHLSQQNNLYIKYIYRENQSFLSCREKVSQSNGTGKAPKELLGKDLTCR